MRHAFVGVVAVGLSMGSFACSSSPSVSGTPGPDGAASSSSSGGGEPSDDGGTAPGQGQPSITDGGPSTGASLDGSTTPSTGGEGGATTVVTDSGSHPIAPGGYYVQGNSIYDATGKAHLFHGVDRTSFEWDPEGQYIDAGDYTIMAGGWDANVVRIPIDQDFWLSTSPIYSAGYAGVIDQQVTGARAAGLDVILDLHWSDRGDISAASNANLGTLPGQQCMADTNSVTFWQEVATKYKTNGHVLFELYNEPHDISWNVWLGGGSTTSGDAGTCADSFTAVGMQALYDTVRGAGAENLVLIGGDNWAYDLSGVPGNRVNGHNVVYVSHVYHHDTGHDESDWPADWGFLTATDPVMLTEFGPFSNQSNDVNCELDYVTDVLDYADTNHVSWSSWAWWVYSGGGTDDGSDYCDYPSILLTRTGEPNSLGQIIQTRLQSY
jgi:endoglucanase